MKNYTIQLVLFKDISKKKVGADFDAGEVSSDAGLLIILSYCMYQVSFIKFMNRSG